MLNSVPISRDELNWLKMRVSGWALVISVVFNLFLMVRLFDVSLSLDYSRSESAINESRSNKLETIIQISLGKMSEENFSEMMDELVDSGFVIKESEGKVVIEGVEVRRKDKQP